jgi:hypothetical protein
MSNPLASLATQNFLVDSADFSQIRYNNYLSVILEIQKNNPQKFSQAQSFIKASLAESIHTNTYQMFYCLLSTGKNLAGESYLRPLSTDPSFQPSYPKQLCSEFAMRAAEISLRIALEAIQIILPDDKSAASRIYVGNNVDTGTAETPPVTTA